MPIMLELPFDSYLPWGEVKKKKKKDLHPLLHTLKHKKHAAVINSEQ